MLVVTIHSSIQQIHMRGHLPGTGTRPGLRDTAQGGSANISQRITNPRSTWRRDRVEFVKVDSGCRVE